MAGIKDRVKKKQQQKKAQNKPDVAGIYDESDLDIKVGEQILKMPISEIYSAPQVRTKFPDDRILEIGHSMLKNGQFSPVVVFPEDPKGYKIHQGECRYRGAKVVGLEFIDVVVRDSGDIFTQIAENIHRIKLDPFDVSKSLNKVKEEKDLTVKQLAEALGYTEAKIKKVLPLYAAPSFIEDAFNNGEVSDIDSINYLMKIAKLDHSHAKELITQKPSREQLSNALKILKSSNKPVIKTLITDTSDDSAAEPLVAELLDAELSDPNTIKAPVTETSNSNNIEAPVTETSNSNNIEAPVTETSNSNNIEAHVTDTIQVTSQDNLGSTVSVSNSVVNILFDDGQGEQEGYILLDRKVDKGNIVIVLRGEVGEHEVEASSVRVVGYGQA